MTDDSVLVSLIRHSVTGETIAERRAARLLLDLLRNGGALDLHRLELASMAEREASTVTDEANRLIVRYGLV